MAKSIRSKWKRKCRAVKRVRYGEKELERLKKTLANDTTSSKDVRDKVMTDIQEVVNVKTAKNIQSSEPQDEQMGDEVKKEFNPRTLRSKDGAYPVWVHPRKTKSTKKSKKNKKNVKRNKK